MKAPKRVLDIIVKTLASPRHLTLLSNNNLSKKLLVNYIINYAIRNSYNVFAVDWHGEYKALPELRFPIQIPYYKLPEFVPFIVDGSVTVRHEAYLATAKAYRQLSAPFDIKSVIRSLEILAETSHSLRSGAIVVASKLSMVKDFIELTENFAFLQHSHRLNLGEINYDKARLLASIYALVVYNYYKKSQHLPQKNLLIFDESQNYAKTSKLLLDLKGKNTKVVEVMQAIPADQEHIARILSNCDIIVGVTGLYSSYLATRYRFPQTISEVQEGEFLVFLGNKRYKLSIF